jgi:hypothetical protein
MVSAVEQCAVHRRPIGAFAARSPAALSFMLLWDGIERKLAQLAARDKAALA